MAKGTGLVGFNIPEQHKRDKRSFDTRPRVVELWVAALPMGNVGETARLVYGALHEVNRLKLPWEERFRFLELFRPPVHYVQRNLGKRYTGMAFPLPPKTRRIAQLSQQLHAEMALGYKSAISDMLEGFFLTRDKRALSTLIHRCIRYLSRSLLTSYQIYAPHPENSWFELHHIYLQAAHRKLDQRPVADPEDKILPESSIARLYKQILLLALASPYRLRQGEAEGVYGALARWAAQAAILPFDAPEADQALFVVHMDSDDEPEYRTFDRRNCDSELCRLIDTRQLTPVLKEELSKAKHTERPELSPNLLRRLIVAWGVAPKREYSRVDREVRVEAVVGLTALFQAIAELGGFEIEAHRSQFESKVIRSATQPDDSGDVWNACMPKEVDTTYFKTLQPPPERQETKQAAQRYKMHRWVVLNESAGGFRVAIQGDREAQVQVGELVGLRSGEMQRWTTGVIRWIREADEGGLEIGVQALSPAAIPVAVRRLSRGSETAEYQRALLLPRLEAIGSGESLLLPIRLFSRGDELRLRDSGTEIDITLAKPMETTGSFIQFGFEHKLQPVHAAAPVAEDEDFAELWGDL